MISALSAATLQIAGFYNQNGYDLSKTLERLSSGKKFLTPADDVSSYMRAKDLQSQADEYGPVITNLSEWKGAMDVTSGAAGEIANTLQRLKELVLLSQQSTDSNQKDAYQSEFTQLVNNVDSIVQNTYYENTYLLNNTTGTTQATVYLNPDTSLNAKLDINLPVAVDTTDLKTVNIGSTAPDYVHAAQYVSDATAANNTFLATAAGYTTTLNSFYNIATTTKTNTLSAVSNISDIDDASELINYTMQSVHQQTATAMMAQANLFSQSVLALFQNM
jgi:Flagellin and related hook-associated proteins